MKKSFVNTRGGKIITAACLGIFLFPAVVCAGDYDDCNGLNFSQGNFTEQNNLSSIGAGMKFDTQQFESRSGESNGNGSLTNKRVSFGGEAWSKPDLSYSSSANRAAQTANREQGISWRQSTGPEFNVSTHEQVSKEGDKWAPKEASVTSFFADEEWRRVDLPENKPADYNGKETDGQFRQPDYAEMSHKELGKQQIPESSSAAYNSGQDNIELLMLHQNEEKQDMELKTGNRQAVRKFPQAPLMKNVQLPKTKKINDSIMEGKNEGLPRISLAGILLKLGIPLILCSGLVWVLVKEGRRILNPLKLYAAKEKLSEGKGL